MPLFDETASAFAVAVGNRSPSSVIAIVLAAFNRAEEMHDIPSPLKGLKKPPSQKLVVGHGPSPRPKSPG